jgi:hypothetical protein
MAWKVLRLISGRLTETEAITTSTGSGDAGKIPALDGGGQLDITFMPSGLGPETVSVTASETLSAGNLVNLWDDAGTIKVRKADATTVGKEAHGFVLAGISSSASGNVYLSGTVTGLSSLTLGGRYYLGTTAGAITTTAPSTSGNVVQPVGVAISATALALNLGEPVTLA